MPFSLQIQLTLIQLNCTITSSNLDLTTFLPVQSTLSHSTHSPAQLHHFSFPVQPTHSHSDSTSPHLLSSNPLTPILLTSLQTSPHLCPSHPCTPIQLTHTHQCALLTPIQLTPIQTSPLLSRSINFTTSRVTLTSPLHLAFWFDAHLTYPAHFPDRGLAHILQQLAPFQTCCWMAPLHTCTLSSPVPTQLLNVDVPGLLTIICTLEPLAFLFDAAGLIYLNVFVPTAPITYQLACARSCDASDLPMHTRATCLFV